MSIIIGIAGGSASGKSTLAERILKESADMNIKLFNMDSYYKPESMLPLVKTANGRTYRDYNCPESFDLKRLKDDIDVAANEYKVIIVEGLLVLWDSEIREKCLLRVFIDCPADIRIVRRIKRNISWGIPFDDIAEVYLDLVRYRHAEFVEPTKQYADIVLDSSRGTDECFEKLITEISRLT